jgi:hypothetical protein
MFGQVEAWLEQLPADELSRKSELLVTIIRNKRRELEATRRLAPKLVKARNHGRAQKARRKEIEEILAFKDDLYPQPEWRDKCKQKMARLAVELLSPVHGLYMRPPLNPRWRFDWRAAWQLPDGTWIETEPLTRQPHPLSNPGNIEVRAICQFHLLYESLSLPRVPVAGGLDPACLITDF